MTGGRNCQVDAMHACKIAHIKHKVQTCRYHEG